MLAKRDFLVGALAIRGAHRIQAVDVPAREFLELFARIVKPVLHLRFLALVRLGKPIGTEFALNTNFFADSEENATVAALPDGGFIVVYEDNDATSRSIRMDRFDASGTAVAGQATIIDDSTANAAPNYSSPVIAVGSATSVLIAWSQTDITPGTSSIQCKIYNPTTDTLSAVIDLIDFDGININPAVTVLTNGHYVIASQTKASDGTTLQDVIGFRIVDSAGVNVQAVTKIASTDSDNEFDGNPSITALTGGGFVIAWENTDANDTDIKFQIFTAGGSLVSIEKTVTFMGTTDNANESFVVALSDGGFLVGYDEDNLGELHIQRFDSGGSSLGSNYVISTGGSITQPTAIILADGRVAVSFVANSGEIAMEILDTRDIPNAGVYTPISRSIGTVGDDVFSGDADANFGFSGNDTITDGVGLNSLYGGTGNDRITISGVNATEVVDGGAGSDTLIGNVMANGTVYNLATGRVVDGAIIEVATGFENVIGTTANEIMIGSSIGNTLSGGGGDDSINGGLGSDKVYGGAGNDTIFVNSTGDSVFEAIGGGNIDRVFASSNFVLTAGSEVERLSAGNSAGAVAINLYGNAFSQTISGNAAVNVLSSGATGGVDILQGFSGNDIYRVFNFGDIIMETAGNGTADRVVAAVSFALAADDNIEFMSTANPAGIAPINLRGNALAQTLQGNAGANQLNGAAGSDTLTGGAGADGFMFNSALGPANVDIITDYNVAADRILLENAVFGGLVAGALGAAAFTANLAGLATDGSDRIIYETDTGFLWFDADGTGGIGRVRFADLASGLVMSASEFTVV